MCTDFHQALKRSFENTNSGEPEVIDEFVILVDNCAGDNTSYVLMAYLDSLVGRGDVDRVEVSFTMVRHTCIKMDKVLSRCVL